MQRVSPFNDNAFASYLMPPAPRAASNPYAASSPYPPVSNPQPPGNPYAYAPPAPVANEPPPPDYSDDLASIKQQLTALAMMRAPTAAAAAPAVAWNMPHHDPPAPAPAFQWSPSAIAIVLALVLVFGLFIMGIVVTTRICSNKA